VIVENVVGVIEADVWLLEDVPMTGLPGVLLVLVSDEMVSLLLVLEVYHVVTIALLELTVCESPDVDEVVGEEV
jgi:hypothetical protein